MPNRASIVIIGWCYIGLAAVSLAAGIFSIGSLLWMKGILRDDPELLDELPRYYSLLFERLNVLFVFLGLEILLSTGLIAVTTGFLRFRAWARTALEYVNWFGILFSTEVLLVTSGVWVLGRTGVLNHLIPMLPVVGFGILHLALIPVGWLLAAGPLFLVNRLIRRSDVRVFFGDGAGINL